MAKGGKEFMGQKIPWLIIKFGQENHLRELQQGKLYMNAWSHFKNCEDHLERKDENEGLHYLIQAGKSEIILNDHRFSPEGGFLGGSIELPDESIKNKVFCACVIFRNEAIREDWKIFDDRIKDFGESFIVIWNLNEFFKRLSDSLIKLKNEGIIEAFESGPIIYYDENNYDGEVGPFRKSTRYAHQKEWRLIARTAGRNDSHFELKMDPIEDICAIGKTDEFKNRIKPKEGENGYILEFN
jgi:hypothetical protein